MTVQIRLSLEERDELQHLSKGMTYADWLGIAIRRHRRLAPITTARDSAQRMQVHIAMPEELYQAISDMAEMREINFSRMIRELIA